MNRCFTSEETPCKTFIRYFDVCGVDSLDLAEVRSKMEAIDAGRTDVKLIAGDIGVTCRKFVDDNPGFKISFLNMDLDLAEPTLKVNRWHM